ncbi:MAG: hypothetical protein RIC16_13660 [Rhodospirillales bacterium]
MAENSNGGEATFFTPKGKVLSSADEVTAGKLGRRPEVRNGVTGSAATGSSQHKKPTRKPRVVPTKVDPTSELEQQADGLADMIHERFMHLLRGRLEETGGSLSEDDVEELSQEFRDQLGDVREVFLNAVSSYVHSNQQQREHNERKASFERLMVHRFENRFAPDHVVARDSSKLSRRMLPGFFNALSLLLGPEKLSRYKEKSTLVKDVLREKLGDEFSWTKLYSSPHARKLSLRAQIDIAPHFQNLDKRIAWLVALVNSNMIPTDDHRPAAGWSFTDAAARQLLKDVFADLAAAMGNKGARDALERELGADSVVSIKTVLQQIY